MSTRVKPKLCQIVVRCAPGFVAALDVVAEGRESRAATIRRLIRDALVEAKGAKEARSILAAQVAPAAPWRGSDGDATDGGGVT